MYPYPYVYLILITSNEVPHVTIELGSKVSFTPVIVTEMLNGIYSFIFSSSDIEIHYTVTKIPVQIK